LESHDEGQILLGRNRDRNSDRAQRAESLGAEPPRPSGT
jgi:hypothetical protein